MRTYQGKSSVHTPLLTLINNTMNDSDLSSPACFQNLRAVRGGAGDHLFWRERLFHLVQQPALA